MSIPALAVHGLSMSYGGLKALDGLSLSFQPGAITGLIGPNGAGKTTLFNVISGFIRPDAGTVTLGSAALVGLPPWRIARLGIGRLFQDVRVFSRLSVLENVLLACDPPSVGNPLRAVLSWGKGARERQEKALNWLAFVGLEVEQGRLAEALSFGQQKLLALARILAADCGILLLDEPSAGLNAGAVSQIQGLLQELARQGKTVVVIEHDMPLIRRIAGQVHFLSEGSVMASGLPEDVLADQTVRQLYLGC